jgi:hypothetical protein
LGLIYFYLWCFNATFSNISAISWRPVLVVEEARVPGQPPTIGKQVVIFIIRVYVIKYKIFHNLKVLPSYYYFLFYQHLQLLLKWTDSLLYNSKPNLAEMSSMRSYTRVVFLCRFVKKHGHHVTLKILIGRFSRNFFSRTSEGIELKSGIYVPMNVFNMCCYCLPNLHKSNNSCVGPHRKHLCQVWFWII